MGRSPRVLGAKVRVPEVRALSRDRLNDLLQRVFEHRLGVVIGPAGSGKTTLLASFAGRNGMPVAWYRAEEGDATKESLLTHLERSVVSAFGEVTPGWESIEDAVSALEKWPGSRGLLVIDDLHSLEGSEAEALLGRLVEYLPPSVGMLAASRRPPRFNLSRLRVSGDLLEITADDLRFRSWEVEQLFRNFYEEPMPPEDLAELARRTEGWAAGLQLFHIATSGKPAHERRLTLSALSGGAKPVREYLARNALEELGNELREFMLATCVLGRLSGALCDEFLGRSGSAELLEELERRQIFTQAVDELGNYRYHEVLRAHLEASLVERIGEFATRNEYRRSAGLLEKAGAAVEALRAYCRAEDWEATARLLGREGSQLAEDPGEWIHALPSSVFEHDPWLLLTTARLYASSGRLVEAAGAYQRAEAAFGPVAARDICAAERRAVSMWISPGLPMSRDWLALCRTATQRDPLGVAARAVEIPGDMGGFVEGLAKCLAGHVREGRDRMVEVSEDPGVNPVLAVLARFVWALASRMAGSAGHADEFERASEEAERAGIPWLTRIGRACTALGGQPEGTAEARAMHEASSRAGDEWGAALSLLIEGVAVMWSDGDPLIPLEKAATRLRDLGAGVLESWATSLLSLALANRGDSRADETAKRAELLARTVAVPGARAIALMALGTLGGPRADEHLSLGTSLSQECGLRSVLEIPPDPLEHLEIKCFGRFVIENGDGPLDLGRLKPRAREVLKLLSIHPGKAIHRETLLEAIWPDSDPEQSTRALHVVISSLRQFFEPGTGRGASRLVLREDDAYRLAIPEQVNSDVLVFEAAIAGGRAGRIAGDSDATLVELSRALDVYTGELLPEVGPAEWVVKKRDRCRNDAGEAALLIAEVSMKRGDHSAAIAAAEKGLHIDKYRDGLWRILIDALDRTGEAAGAARARAAYGETLEELGVIPNETAEKVATSS